MGGAARLALHCIGQWMNTTHTSLLIWVGSGWPPPSSWSSTTYYSTVHGLGWNSAGRDCHCLPRFIIFTITITVTITWSSPLLSYPTCSYIPFDIRSGFSSGGNKSWIHCIVFIHRREGVYTVLRAVDRVDPIRCNPRPVQQNNACVSNLLPLPVCLPCP
jgi:hypothetical protein